MALDLKDKKILHELDINARRTLSQLSKKVNLSRDVINYRINKLEKEGYIKGYQTIVNFSKLGYLTIRFHLKSILYYKDDNINVLLLNHILYQIMDNLYNLYLYNLYTDF